MERKRYYEVSRGSVVEIDAALDIANDLNYLMQIETENLGRSLINCFKMLTGMIGSTIGDN
jgi:four helix bundle protein